MFIGHDAACRYRLPRLESHAGRGVAFSSLSRLGVERVDGIAHVAASVAGDARLEGYGRFVVAMQRARYQAAVAIKVRS